MSGNLTSDINKPPRRSFSHFTSEENGWFGFIIKENPQIKTHQIQQLFQQKFPNSVRGKHKKSLRDKASRLRRLFAKSTEEDSSSSIDSEQISSLSDLIPEHRRPQTTMPSPPKIPFVKPRGERNFPLFCVEQTTDGNYQLDAEGMGKGIKIVMKAKMDPTSRKIIRKFTIISIGDQDPMPTLPTYELTIESKTDSLHQTFSGN